MQLKRLMKVGHSRRFYNDTPAAFGQDETLRRGRGSIRPRRQRAGPRHSPSDTRRIQSNYAHQHVTISLMLWGTN